MLLEIFRKYIGILLIGIVIKLLDDDVDEDKRNKSFHSKIYRDLTAYKLPYCLLFLSLSMLLETYLVFSLFTCAYMIGMFHFPGQKLPLHLKAYQEMALLAIINIFFIPLEIFFFAFTSILLIQLIDDLMDKAYDFKYGYKNFVNKFGKGEIILVSSILLILCLMLSWTNTMIVLSSSFFINYLYSKI
ncbi:hypothetical protein [Clostridium formicaceticum]|uniref:Uncharacterized protein n=1 Tax=Clostridium formicaceticum TaxID=1497 RepID=A0AAC9WG78_9CLOT|nr:hypothetical protein [Clostridium formicaceticum]AOY77168.1 hypothetical protein BJL90_15715 [Clostridium formicaceticum]ARE87687.1 hypothetical protein CLFO_20870 [Clostridium formicaceticum]